MYSIFSEGFLLGLSTGFYCLASCLPILVPYIMSEGRNLWKANFFIFLQFLAGRFAAYMLFAALATIAGKAGEYEMPPWVLPACLFACGALMVFLALARVRGTHGPCLMNKDLNPLFKRLPVALGFATGINVCPPFAAGFLRLMQLADFAKGTAYFCGFYAATSLFMSPVMFGTPWMGQRAREIGRLTLLLAGLWYGGSGLLQLLQ